MAPVQVRDLLCLHDAGTVCGGLLHSNKYRRDALADNITMLSSKTFSFEVLKHNLLIQLKQLCYALAFCKGGLHWEAVGLHHGTVVLLMSLAKL